MFGIFYFLLALVLYHGILNNSIKGDFSQSLKPEKQE